ncbi:alanine dehydrogenase [Petrimonas sp.]|uniref:alanine dehydrogenase n=1 Tax=Petrimonas sp. TaxID=2023866 RepID=UPI003F50DE25
MMYEPLKSTQFIVRELLLSVDKQSISLVIGIPRENQKIEKRLAITPETTALLVEAGYRVIVEADAGLTINYSDRYYADSGAQIVGSKAEVFQADIILKILPPTVEEILLMKPRSSVFSFLQLHLISSSTLELMAEKRINALAYELIYDDNQVSPFVTAISEIEGACSISVASELLSNAHGGKGILLGGIPGISPTEVVIIGAGGAGTVAARAALALGATVKIFDNDINKLRKIQHELGRTVFTSTLQPNVLRNVFRSADVAIGAMQYVNKTHFYRISTDLIREMKKGSVIIDLRMSQGGCFETTMEACLPGHPDIFERFGILHFCELSLSSRVARTASIALSNIFISMFTAMADSGGVGQFARFDRGFAAGFYVFSGKMVNSYVANHFNLPVNDIGLFLPGL